MQTLQAVIGNWAPVPGPGTQGGTAPGRCSFPFSGQRDADVRPGSLPPLSCVLIFPFLSLFYLWLLWPLTIALFLQKSPDEEVCLCASVAQGPLHACQPVLQSCSLTLLILGAKMAPWRACPAPPRFSLCFHWEEAALSQVSVQVSAWMTQTQDMSRIYLFVHLQIFRPQP